MTDLTDWTLVRSFLAVMRRGSLSGAARSTGQTQPTIGRHIEQLEQALGMSLFTRSSSGLIPTAGGQALVVHAEAMEDAMAALVRAADAGTNVASPTGCVRISASEIMGQVVVPPLLKNLRFAHPGIILELALNNRTDDLLRRTADIAVRMVRPVQAGLVARKIGEIYLGFYAHRVYAERFGLPRSIEELGRFHVIGFDRDDHSARSVAAGTLPITRDLFAFRCDNDAAQLAAIEAGLGIGVIQTMIARSNVDLVPVLGEAISLKLECWLAVHEDQKDQPAIRAVFDCLATGLHRWIEGETSGTG
jgi:DNA-binding transcriptional LysR family regulator